MIATQIRTSHFLQVLLLALCVSPRKVLEAVYWRLLGRKVRSRNVAFATAARSPHYYRLWMRLWEGPAVTRVLGGMECSLPDTSVTILPLMLGGGSTADIAATIRSLQAAFGADVTIYAEQGEGATGAVILPMGSTFGDLLERIGGEAERIWLVPLIAGDRISEHAGRALAVSLGPDDRDIVYWDEDRLDNGCRTAPFLKPDWDDLLFLACDILTGTAAFRLSAIRQASGDLLDMPITIETIRRLAIVMAARNRAGEPWHVPLILSHRQATSLEAEAEARAAIFPSLWSEAVEFAVDKDVPTIRFPLPDPAPSVSVIIPTRDRLELLRTSVEGVLRVQYPGPVELIVVDNESTDTEVLRYIADLAARGVKIIKASGDFNFSALNNSAAEEASGTFLCLLNNDIEMLDGEWLSALVRHGSRPGVGAVGALLLYPDGTVQHSGVAIGVGGAAGHIHREVDVNAVGHHCLHRLSRRVSAVTAACLLVRKQVFQSVGGLDAETFAVAFNDVDFCLKLRREGLINIIATDACLVHHESKSRGSDMSPTNIERFRRELGALQARWGTVDRLDPYHHPLLLRSFEQFVLAPA